MLKYLSAIGCAIVVISIVYKNYDAPDHYIAAVVEYKPVEYESVREMVLENLNNYEQIIANASSYDVDIIVFPEYGLNGIHMPQIRERAKKYLTQVPAPEDLIIPHLDERYRNNEILRKISAAAKNYNMYVVINLSEIEVCNKADPTCPEDGTYHYNTNVVFDRNGAIVAKYRKRNLFCEWAFDQPKQQRDYLSTFVTDFGVKFGIFTCFDIFFKTPSIDLIEQTNTNHIIFTTAWMSQFPFFTAITLHSAWSHLMRVTMLSSNYNDFGEAATGSGIYLANGVILASSTCQPNSKILISNVPKNPSFESVNLTSFFEQLLKTINGYIRNISYGNSNNNNNDNDKSVQKLLINNSYATNVFGKMKFYRDMDINKLYVSKSLKFPPKRDNDIDTVDYFEYARDDEFFCNIKISYRSESSAEQSRSFNHFKLLAYSGVKDLNVTTGYMEICALSIVPVETADDKIMVSADDITSLPIPIVNSIAITVKSNIFTTISLPVTVNTKFYPMSAREFTFSSQFERTDDTAANGTYSFQMKLVKSPISNLLTFGVIRLKVNEYIV